MKESPPKYADAFKTPDAKKFLNKGTSEAIPAMTPDKIASGNEFRLYSATKQQSQEEKKEAAALLAG